MPKNNTRSRAPSDKDLDKIREEIREQVLAELEERRGGDPEDEEAGKLGEFQEKFNGKKYWIRAEKFNKEESDYDFVKKFPLDNFDPYSLLQPWGPGKYRLTLLNEKGKYVEGGRDEVRIAALPEAAAGEVKKANDNPLENPVIALMLKQGQDAQAQMTELLKAIITKPTAEPAHKPASQIEMIDALAKLKALSPSDESFGKKMTEFFGMMDMFERMRERGGNGGGDSEGGGGFLQMFRDGVQALKEVEQLRKSGRPLTVIPHEPDAPQPGAGGGAPPVRVNINGGSAAPPPPPPQENQLMKQVLEGHAQHIEILVQKAAEGADVAETAGWLIDQIYDFSIPLIRRNFTAARFFGDDSIVEQAMNRAKDPEQIALIYQYVPQLAPHREWCSRVIDKAIEQLNTPETPPQ